MGEIRRLAAHSNPLALYNLVYNWFSQHFRKIAQVFIVYKLSSEFVCLFGGLPDGGKMRKTCHFV